jgi:hypothetical protein
MPRGRGAGAEFVRNDITERVATQMTRHKTESVYRRYAIADERD